MFVGHSEAGKTTTTRMLMESGEDVEILCDDRNIVRRFEDGWRVYGSWSHGDIDQVSAASAPLKAVFFLEQAPENLLLRITDPTDNVKRLLACVIKPFTTLDWWDQTLTAIDALTGEVPCYRMRFTKSGQIVMILKHFLRGIPLDLSNNK